MDSAQFRSKRLPGAELGSPLAMGLGDRVWGFVSDEDRSGWCPQCAVICGVVRFWMKTGIIDAGTWPEVGGCGGLASLGYCFPGLLLAEARGCLGF